MPDFFPYPPMFKERIPEVFAAIAAAIRDGKEASAREHLERILREAEERACAREYAALSAGRSIERAEREGRSHHYGASAAYRAGKWYGRQPI